jgi:hypothetical protein
MNGSLVVFPRYRLRRRITRLSDRPQPGGHFRFQSFRLRCLRVTPGSSVVATFRAGRVDRDDNAFLMYVPGR